MRLSRYFFIMVMLTVVSLTYIQLQIQIIDLAYQGRRKEKQLQQMVDFNDEIQQKILKMKSADHLGDQLLNKSSKLQFLDNHRIVRSRSLDGQTVLAKRNKEAAPKTNFFTQLFSLKSKAEASILAEGFSRRELR